MLLKKCNAKNKRLHKRFLSHALLVGQVIIFIKQSYRQLAQPVSKLPIFFSLKPLVTTIPPGIRSLVVQLRH